MARRDMAIVLPETVSRSIFCYGFFDEYVSRLMIEAVKPGDVVFDVGAHFGFFTLLGTELTGYAGSVHSFEPTPSTFDMLSVNCREESNVKLVNAAVGRSAGYASLRDYGVLGSAWNFMGAHDRKGQDDAFSTEIGNVEVEVITLDEYCQTHSVIPDVIKIDTENFEYEVFLGAETTLRTNYPRVILECMSDFSFSVGQALINMGYDVYTTDGCDIYVREHVNWAELNSSESNVLFMMNSSDSEKG